MPNAPCLPGFKFSRLPADNYGAWLFRYLDSEAGPGTTPVELLTDTKTHDDSTTAKHAEQDETHTEERDSPDPNADYSGEIDLLSDPSSDFVLVTEEGTDKPVGFAWWQHAKSKSPPEWAEWLEGVTNRKEPPHELDALTRIARLRKRAEILGPRGSFMLKNLFVIRSYQRRGIGSVLVDHGLRKADQLGICSYVEGTPVALKLYRAKGFVSVDKVTVDLEPWGGKAGEQNDYTLMVREPQTVQY